MPRRLPDGRWLADVRPWGSTGPRRRKHCSDKAEALRFEAYWLNKGTQQPWNPPPPDRRKISDLVELWYRLHGRQLKDGERRLKRLQDLAARLGDPLVAQFTAQSWTDYRARRVQAVVPERRKKDADTVTPATVNHEHAYLRAVFNELRRLGEFNGPNPLQDVRRFKTDESEMAYLQADEIERLLAAATAEGTRNPHLELVILVCLATGARWSEAEGLTIHQVRAGQITFNRTKSGKTRTVPIQPALEERLRAHRDAHLLAGGRLFEHCYSAFRKAAPRAGLELPRGQLAHVLRHTFASHFMMAGGNLLTLQRILGHTDIKMTMRYAHLAPEHLEEARRLNPIGRFLDTGNFEGSAEERKSLQIQ